MKLLDVVGSISDRYIEETQKPFDIQECEESLTQNIKPSDIYVYGGEGALLRTSRGELIDLSSMTVNAVLGQNDPWVKANIIAYLLTNRPSFLSTRFGSEFYYRLAQKLQTVMGMKDSVVNHRQCNGSDATELAILSAYETKKTEGRNTLVSFRGSYHGQNLTSYLSSDLQRKNIFWLKEKDAKIKFFNPPEIEEQEDEILLNIQKLKNKIFAVILEPIQANNNLYGFDPKFLRKLKDLCEKEEIALIFDEIQSAFGWLGKMSAAELLGVNPDIMAVSKGLTAGFGPLSAIIANRKYQNIPYGTGEKTNGADVRSLVAANAVLDRLNGINESDIPDNLEDTLKEELKIGLLAEVGKKAIIISASLTEIANKFPEKVSIHGSLLIRGIKFTDPTNLDMAYKKLLEEGVYVRKSRNSLIIKPPLVITNAQLQQALEKIHKVLELVFC